MSVTQIEELRARRKGLLDEMREIQSGAEAADRDLTAEETQEFERREADFGRITERIEREEKLEGLSVAERGNPINPATEEVEVRGPSIDPAENEALEVRGFEKLVRNKLNPVNLDAEERAALKVGSDSLGGHTVPKMFERQLIESLRTISPIAGLATHITTTEGGDLSIPTVATNSTATWVAEEGPYQFNEGTFGTVTLKAYKAASIAKVSDELLHDSAFDILGWLAKDLGESLGVLAGTGYETGASNSTTTPRGIATSATTVTGATTATTAVGDLFTLYHDLASPYRATASWLMNDAVVKVVRLWTESANGQFLWQPGLQAGQPDLLFGRPVYTANSMDSAVSTTGKKIVVFGDIARAYVIRNVQGIELKVLDQLYAVNGQVGFRAALRTDGAIRDANAARTLIVK